MKRSPAKSYRWLPIIAAFIGALIGACMSVGVIAFLRTQDDEQPATAPRAVTAQPAAACKHRRRVVVVRLDPVKHRHVLRHARRAENRGEPVVLHIARSQADANRRASLKGVPTWSELTAEQRQKADPDHPAKSDTHDRDEFPAAISAEGGDGGPVDSPRGRLADIAYVLSGENRSAGAVMRNALDGFCDGQRFRYGRKR